MPPSKDRPYRDREWLRQKYVGERLSTYDIADACDVSQRTISYWVQKHDIEARDPSKRPPHYSTDHRGYERWWVSVDGDLRTVAVHRLAAVAWFGWDAVVGNDVHHVNGLSWDTREGNVKPTGRSKHRALHTVRRERNDDGTLR